MGGSGRAHKQYLLFFLECICFLDVYRHNGGDLWIVMEKITAVSW